jgi:hypothetical protein
MFCRVQPPLRPPETRKRRDTKGLDDLNAQPRTGDRYLKIDTEGGDFDVLEGSEGMITRYKIDVVEVEGE